MDPIATYFERRIDWRTQFLLFPNEILIIGKRLAGPHYETRIPLKTLDPIITRWFSRSTLFLAGICLALGSTFICVVLRTAEVSWLSYWMNWTFVVVGIFGFALVTLTFRKIEYARFRNEAGIIVLNIARSGPERRKFDEFIDTMVRQIKTLKAAS